ncbi:MAG: tRNA lysidine(34) synthetase TilS [Planctomycetota bacterium]|jgi:tRNA(Ile)-lysidine synthase
MDSFDRLTDTVARCLCRFDSVAAERPVLAAVSGGVDSTALLLALARLRRDGRLSGPLHAAHVDHGVRADSARNAHHVATLCERLDVPLTVHRLPLRAGHASEESLRDGRYAALHDAARVIDAGLLLTGHHADDNLETVLFRMLRGTGPRGLAGIPEARWLGAGARRSLVVRPLLRCRRSTLERALADLGETAYEDATNRDVRYARNELRLQTIPTLRASLGLGLDVALMTVASTARAASDLLEAQGLRILSQRGRHKTGWSFELDLRGLDPDAAPFVREALRLAHQSLCPRGRAPTSAWLDRAQALLRAHDGTRLAGRGGLLVERTRDGVLLVDPARAPAPPAEALQPFACDEGPQRFGATEWTLTGIAHPLPPLAPSPGSAGRFRALLDPRAAPWPWAMRTRRPGDRFRPLGCDRDLELRRFLQGRHVPRFHRDRLPLLVDREDRVLWVPGGEVSDGARLQLNTRRCIEVVARCG